MNEPRHSSPPRISLLHATRGRPDQAAECRERWLRLAHARDSIEHLFAVDFDDASSLKRLASFNPLVVKDPNGGCVAAWNLAAAISTGDVLVQLSDDWVPPEGWDQQILSAIGECFKSSVLRVSDGHRTDDLLCIAILTKARLQQQGFLFCPEYQGVYSDDEFSFRAYKDGVVTQQTGLCFTHAHPHYDSGIQIDQTYILQNSEERKRNGLLTFARRNPDAFGKWVHHGSDERHYHAEPGLNDVQQQIVKALADIKWLLDRQDALIQSLAQWQAEVERFKAEGDRFKAEGDRFKAEAEHLKAGVDEWNRRSWMARAFHKLRIGARQCGPQDT